MGELNLFTEVGETSQLTARLEESQLLFEISQMLASTVDLTTMLQQIADAANTLISSATRTVLHLLNDDADYLQSVAVSGLDSPRTNQRTRFNLGEGIAGIALDTGQTINVPDILLEPRFLPVKYNGQYPPRSLLVAPVKTADKSLGTLSVQSPTPNVFTSNDERLLTILGIQAALAIDKANILRNECEQRELAESLMAISAALNQTLEYEKILELLLEKVERLIPHDYAYIFSIEDNFMVFTRSNSHDLIDETNLEALKNLHIPMDDFPTIREIVKKGKPINFPKSSKEIAKFGQLINPRIKSWLAAPIIAQEKAIAFFMIGKLSPSFYFLKHSQWLEAYSTQGALALQKAKLFETTEQSLKDLQISLEHEKTFRNQLVQAEKLAALGRIVASVAHELNNPLQAIQNALYLIKVEESLTQQAREDLQTVIDEAERMANLIGRLREIYRPTRHEEFQLESINLLILEVHKLLGTHLRHKQITFEFYPNKKLPKASMIKDQVKQVILNICLNAVEAMPEGGYLTVRTSLHSKTRQIVLSISDTGPSINADILPYIFDPFITTKEGGTGLGLAISYDIVRRHGGSIDVISEPGVGTTFKVWLPIEQENPHNSHSDTKG